MQIKINIMKGLDAFPKSKETLAKLIYNLKKPIKGKILEEEYDKFDIKENQYSCQPQTPCVYDNIYANQKTNKMPTNETIYFSFENFTEISDHDDDAVINIKPRNRILNSISEVSLSDESLNSISSSPSRDVFEISSNQNLSISPACIPAEDELDQYLRPDEINNNYAHIDAELLNKFEDMQATKPNRGRLGSTPTIIHHSRDFVETKHLGACGLSHNNHECQDDSSCNCAFQEKVKRTQSVDETTFCLARNSSSYNKFKNSKGASRTSGFARYIIINGVEYKVPSNVPKHDPPDLEPPPPLPPKRSSVVKIIRKALSKERLNGEASESSANNDTESTNATTDFDIVNKLEDLVNMIKELQRDEIQAVIECPTYVKDSSYIDTIRQKRRKKSTRDRFQSCPSTSFDTQSCFEMSIKTSKSVPLLYEDENDKPHVVNYYTLSTDSPVTERKDLSNMNNYELFVASKTNRNENEAYSSPYVDLQKIKQLAERNESNGYAYAFPADRNLSEKMDYQYAYGHTQHILHPKANRKNPTIKHPPLLSNHSDVCDANISKSSPSYANIKCFDTIPKKNLYDNKNNNLSVAQETNPYKNIFKERTRYKLPESHEYALINPIYNRDIKPIAVEKSNDNLLLPDENKLKYSNFDAKGYMIPLDIQ